MMMTKALLLALRIANLFGLLTDLNAEEFGCPPMVEQDVS